jgi:hypothetical protein
MSKTEAIDAKTLLELKRRIGQTAGPTFPVSLSSGTLEILINAYMERAALVLINSQMEAQGAEIAPYWAHHMMADVLRKWVCSRGEGPHGDTCRGSCLCITEYCHSCYAKFWWENQPDGCPNGDIAQHALHELEEIINAPK